MNGYAKKVSRTLILGLIIFLVCAIIYLVYPKYQIVSDSGKIYKVNKVTGSINVIRYTSSSKPLKPLLYHNKPIIP